MDARNAMTRVLVIAGSDSSGGAGVLRDLQVLAEHGARGCCAITAVTAQTRHSVAAVHHVPPALVAEQINCALQEGVDAIKIGMLGKSETVRAVASALAASSLPVVIDPVLLASSGAALLDDDGRRALLELVAPRASLVTPNLPEARALLGRADDDAAALAQAMARAAGCPALVKGGHAEGAVAIDWLCEGDTLTALEGPRLSARMRGTGCALSTAIAIHLARGASLRRASELGKAYVATLLRAQDPDGSL